MNGFFLLLAATGEPDIARVLEPVIVVAERRDVVSSDVPLSIGSVSADELEDRSLDTIGDLGRTLPSVQFKSIFGSSAPQIYIRGIGNTDVNPSANPGVAIYLDDTLVSSPLGQGLLLFDLERVDVLKGPQGTLFGRNATGGALVLITKEPSRSPGGKLNLATGSDGFRSFGGAVDTGQLGAVRLRLAGLARASDGYTDNSLGANANELDEYALRLTAELDLSSAWTGRFTGDYGADRSTMTAHEGRGLFDPGALAASSPGAPQLVACAPERVLASQCANLLGYVYTRDPYTEGFDQPGREDLDAGGVSFSFERTGPVNVRSITAWRAGERDILQDTDASPLSIAELGFENSQETLTQEFLLDGRAGLLDWRAGVFGLRETLDTVNRYNTLQSLRDQGAPFIPDPALFFLGPFRLAQTYRQEIMSGAIFADGDYQLTGRLAVTAGLRLTREETRFETLTSFDEAISQAVLSPMRKGDVQTDEASWRMAALYRLSENVNAYASVSRGFKSANFNGGALFPFDGIGPVSPERLTAYEAGIKAELSARLRADLSIYAYDYEGLQTFTFRPVPPPTRQVLDSGDADVLGLDASVTALLPLGLQGNLSATLLDAAFTDFIDANGVNRSGNPLPNASDVSLAASLSGSSSVTSRLDLEYAVYANYRSQVSFDTTDNPLLSSPERTLVDARLAIVDTERSLTLALEASNLGDEAVVVDALNIAEYGLIQQTYGLPRQFVLRLEKSF